MMQKLRIKFSKEGPASYISHLDLMRTFERSLRRAELSLAFSEGFNPHPKMSFASALSLGLTSQGEYLDIELEKEVSLEQILSRLNKVLPAGIKALKVEEIKDKGSAMSLIEAASYQISGQSNWEKEKWQQVLKNLLEQKEIIITRDGKNGLREVDVSPFLLQVTLQELEGEKFTLSLTVRAGSKGNLRPQEVLQALEKYYQLLCSQIKIRRTDLYKLQKDQLKPLL